MSAESPDLTLAICTHNPVREVLARTVDSVRAQQAPGLRLALLVVDNASHPPLTGTELGFDRFPFPARVCGEPELGLAAARWRAYHETASDLVLYVDDDNLLAPDYAAQVVQCFTRRPRAGVIGGRSVALPEVPLPSWMSGPLLKHLAVRDLGDEPVRFLDEQTPLGAGMAVRRSAMQSARVKEWVFSDRKGDQLSSFGDSELCYRIRIAGWELWYEPALRLEHVLPARRLTPEYFQRFLESMGRDWPRLEFFWAPGTRWRRLSYLKRALGLWLKARLSPMPSEPDVRIQWEIQRAFDRGLRQELVRLAFGPNIWRNVPHLTPGK